MSSQRTAAQDLQELKQHLQIYQQPDDIKAALALFISIFIQFAAIMMIHYNLQLIGWTLHTLNIIRLFIQFHDLGHQSFFSSALLNRLIGKIIGIYIHFPYDFWREGHNFHHKNFGEVDNQTIFFTKQQYQKMEFKKRILYRILRQPIIFFLISLPFAWFFGLFYFIYRRFGMFNQIILEKSLSVLLFTLVPSLLDISWTRMWLSVYIALIIGSIIFHLQHSVNLADSSRKKYWNFFTSAMQGSTCLHVPYFFKPFTHGVEYHHIHHVNPYIPSYFLTQCHQAYESKNKDGNYWNKFHINRVSYSQAISSLSHTMFDEETNSFVSFNYEF